MGVWLNRLLNLYFGRLHWFSIYIYFWTVFSGVELLFPKISIFLLALLPTDFRTFSILFLTFFGQHLHRFLLTHTLTNFWHFKWNWRKFDNWHVSFMPLPAAGILIQRSFVLHVFLGLFHWFAFTTNATCSALRAFNLSFTFCFLLKTLAWTLPKVQHFDSVL